MRTTTPRSGPPGTAERQHASDFTELRRRVQAAGLLGRRPGWYVVRAALLVGAFAGAVTALLLLGPTWWQLLVAGLFGVLFTQTAFLAHDSAHRQVFSSNARNAALSRWIGNLGVGLSYGWWMHKHSRHHANPNTMGKDGDIEPGALVFTPIDAASRTGLPGRLMRLQGWFFFPLLLLAGVDLHRNAVLAVIKGEHVEHRLLEGALIAARLLGFPVLVFLAAGPIVGAAFMGVQLAVFGFTMGASFAPNHKGMAIIDARERLDHLRRQVLTSRNIRGGLLVRVGMGGLNFQIEHHLFPSMPSVNLRRARPIVRQYCAELGVPYTETTLLQSWRIVVRYLQRVGLRHADPFDCPPAARFRAA
ncbi:fatty acid desaturase family protein [Amnibacterium sp.]|uniref:fatty acid desaturase family protein n=1 Tax=Amnibacterium sp. TaxID=1872496 RepID=UPI003F7B98F2